MFPPILCEGDDQLREARRGVGHCVVNPGRGAANWRVEERPTARLDGSRHVRATAAPPSD